VNTYTNYRDGLDAIDDRGCVYAPEGPGLGAEIDWDYIYARRTGGAVYER
jgi:L-alanine-DL-glutamate epimerase-like enolase superfamily enzyme